MGSSPSRAYLDRVRRPGWIPDEPARRTNSRAGLGDGQRRRRSRRAARGHAAWIEERNPAVNAIVDTFPAEVAARCSPRPRAARCTACRSRSRTSGRSMARGAAGGRRARRTGAGGRRIGALPGPSRRRGGDRRGREHARYGSGSTGHVSAYGPARNPWDTDRCPADRRAARRAVVARLVGGAVGADGVGSIRYPAAYCGLTGLKPTFGRATMAGHHVPQTTTIVSGPPCRDAADCRLLGGVLFGEDSPRETPTGCGSASFRAALGRLRRRGHRRLPRRVGGTSPGDELHRHRGRLRGARSTC